MNRTDYANTLTTTRLAGVLFAAFMTLAVMSVLAEQLHIERFGEGAAVVELERVTVTAKRPAGERALAAAPASSRTN